MTVATQVRKIDPITGNGVTRTFSFSPMVINDSDELEVVTTVIATGVETVVALGTGATTYSISIVAYPATGSISFPAAGGTLLPSTETITIRRVLTIENLTDLESQGGYDPSVQELQFDKFAMIMLMLQELIDRSLKFPLSIATTISSALPSPTALYFLRSNSTNTALEFAELASTDAALSSETPAQGVIATGAVGTSADIARADHSHQSPDSVITASNMYNAENFI